jgi:3-oxoacyl-[acyl-carrier-protein] synthase II
MMPERRVVVTGIGPVTAVGIGVRDFWNGLRREHSPIRRITRFDASPWRTQIAAEVDEFVPADFMDAKTARRLDRFTHFSIASTRLAIADAGLERITLDGDRVAVQFGSALGGLAFAESQGESYAARGPRGVDPRVALTTFAGAASCVVAIEFGFTGPNATNAMSCASGTIAIGDAFRIIRSGDADVAVAGGVEAPLAPLCFGAFAIIRAMSTRNTEPSAACRPFDAGRDGFVMGEGACTLVLEERQHAIQRGARIYAEIAGYGVTNDAHHMTAPRPDGSQAARAMRIAIANAGIQPRDIDFISPHGSSTPLNDATESIAIKTVLGEHAFAVPISGSKPYHAHALGASGAIEAALCCLAMHHRWIPPTLNFHGGDPSCDLDYVADHGRDANVRTALSNSFGFGGINASLVLRA